MADKKQELARAREIITRMDEQNEPSAFEEYLSFLTGNWPLILPLLFVGLLLGAFQAWVTPRSFTSDALVQVETRSTGLPSAEIYSASSFGRFSTPAQTEIDIIKSRAMLVSAVKQASVDVVVTPLYPPFIGDAIARRNVPSGEPRQPPLAWPPLKKYAWGGEKVVISSFSVPENLRGQRFMLRAKSAEALFDLILPDGSIHSGKIGELSTFNSADGPVTLSLPELKARPETEFSVVKKSEIAAANGLAGGLQIAESTKGTGVLRLTLTASSPALAQRALSGVVNAYVQQNIDRSAAEAQRRLDFLSTQLPKVKVDLETSQNRLQALKSKVGSVQDMSATASDLSQKYDNVEIELMKLSLERDQLLQKFTENHPAVISVEATRDRLMTERNRLTSALTKLPEAEGAFVQAIRDEKVSSELYTLLLNQSQQLSVAKAGVIGNVRVIDEPLPGLLSGPKKGTITATYALGALIFGIALVLVRRIIVGHIDSAEEIERKLGIPVFATVPRSMAESKSFRLARGKNRPRQILAHAQSEDIAVEAIRSLRTSLQFALSGADSNRIAIVGPAPGVGKSFVASNLAYVTAETGKRVLLIDADLRRGRLHIALGLDRKIGMSEYLSRQLPLEQVVKPVAVHPNLMVITTGAIPPNPSELLMSEMFARLCQEVSQQFDYIFIDTPPLLSVSDAQIICQQTSVSLLVARAGKTSLPEVRSSAKRLIQHGVTVNGVVYNDFTLRIGRYGYREYRYAYSGYRSVE